jgi:hemolysin activation/secretion protein
LLLLNDLAGVGEARASLQSGENVGETDLSVDVSAAPAFSGGAEYDNHGNRFTGSNRLGVRLDVSSPLGLGDALTARLTKGVTGLEFARFGYQLPLGGDGFRVGGAYSNSHYRLGKTFASLAAQGESDNSTLHVSYPLIRSRDLNLHGKVSYDWSHFQDRVGSTGTVIDKGTQVMNIALAGDAHGDSGSSVTVFSLNHGSGRVNIETPEARATDDASARTNGHFRKWTLNLLRLQSLGEHTSVYVSVAGQKASKNLDSSEKFVLGGASGVRAYPQGEAPGDSGYIVSAELRHTFGVAMLPGVLQPFVFVDAGGVKTNEKPYISGTNRRHLSGAGAGITWAKSGDWQVKLTLATRLGNQPAASDTDRRTRGWVQVIKSF